MSAFGGVIAVNRPVSVAMAEQVAEIFTEVVVAPDYEDGAVEVLARKKNIRVLRCPVDEQPDPVEFRRISGGLLMQHVDHVSAASTAAATTRRPGRSPPASRPPSSSSPTWPSPGRPAAR